jgi:hypothetical protein
VLNAIEEHITTKTSASAIDNAELYLSESLKEKNILG